MLFWGYYCLKGAFFSSFRGGFLTFINKKAVCGHNLGLNPLPIEKVAVPLHRQKEKTPGDKDNKTH